MKALADPARLRLVALCRQGECSVSELACVIGLSQPRVSQHLRQLCESGLLDRFRDGRRIFYRMAPGRATGAQRLVGLIPTDEPLLDTDAALLKSLRATDRETSVAVRQDAHRRVAGRPYVSRPDASKRGAEETDAGDRALHRALLDLTVAAPVGDLLDIGCGRGRTLKLLANRANRAVGVDIDATARQLARTELLLAGLPNCSLRYGDMYRLPFEDREFDTVILDDVLGIAERPASALLEAKRLLRDGGRLVILQRLASARSGELQRALAEWSSAAGLRLGPARLVPAIQPQWLLSAATLAAGNVAAA
ncbi:MAG: metalloregulator ArsR/SmtB family transcription factor [Woeseia sp.]